MLLRQFHVLAEFDEGKRSCRRRLAGHNERRRKPQPDPFLLTSSGTSIFQDIRHTLPAPGERHYLMQHPRQTNTLHNPDSKHSYGKATWSKLGSFPEHSNLAYQLQLPGMERFLPNLSQPAADKLYMLLQQPKAASTTARSQGVQFLQGSGSLGHGLTLSPSSGLLAGLEGTQVPHRCTGSLDSGCALSLLSSHPWSSKAPSSVSLDVSPKSDLTLEQMIAENRTAFTTHFSPRSSTEFQHELTQTSDKCFSMLPISQENSTISTGMSFPALNSAESAQHQAPFSLINNLDNRAMLSILQGHDARVSHDADSHHMKPTIDLMTLPSAQTRHIRPYGSSLSESTSGQYVDMQSLRFEPSMFDAS
ncbi:hypothetical protein O6H91_23G069700 [Diphasiastrum complanatum]|uniref:Uncharacterized protein n=1 Tax=Diphasiastrum complanatum TaxID=34168 RepID=A0ACC2ABZ8_DIPCM|nr:hypothetical protein O6H91_23G069700 [Diphasiastrum complanatum]